MPPKNPVRAARQAGRQQVRAARVTNRQDERTVRTGKKIANIQARTATKIARINAKPTPKTESKVKAYPAAKAVEKKSTATTPTASTKTTPKTGFTGKDLLTYGVKPKAPAAKGPSYAPYKSPAAQQQSQQMTTDAKRRAVEAAAKKATDDAKKAAAPKTAPKKDAPKKTATDAKKKQEAANKKKADAAAVEAQRVKDMFLGQGETRQNTLPYTFTDKAKANEGKKADVGRYGPSSKNDYIGIQNFDRMKNNAYGQAPEGPAVKRNYVTKRRGGSIKRKK